MFRRFAMAVSGVVLAFSGASAASAQTGPVITFFGAPFPVVGAQSGRTDYSAVPLSDGWTVSSPNGIANADVQICDEFCYQTLWTYPPGGKPGGADTVHGRAQWNQPIQNTSGNDSAVLEGTATDELGNSSTNSTNTIYPRLRRSSNASYGPGWRTARSPSYIGGWVNGKPSGQIHYSAKPGATATFQVSGSSSYPARVSFISDTGPAMGVVALSINGHTKDVSLRTGTANVSRVIVWNSGLLNLDEAYTLSVRVISGRVDVEGFITN